jgi:hypothetical protein
MSTPGSDGEPVSPAGAEVARLVDALRLQVAFLPTNGSGITPWRRLIVLDTSYAGQGQVERPGKVALVAHELTHLLQRELADPEYWPSGGFRLAWPRRPLGDSTNYMEALAYAVGNSVQLDLRAAEGLPQDQQLLDDLATFTGDDAANAARYVVTRHPDIVIYRQNYRIERRKQDHRIPDGGWQHWLGEVGFEQLALDHMQAQAAQGQIQVVDEQKLPA